MNKTLGERFYQIIDNQKPYHTNSASNLPLISLNQLETKFNSFKKKRHDKQNLNEDSIMMNKEINVCSPFYDRMKTHKQNCKCPYHRKQRFSLLPVRHTVKSGFALNKSVNKHDSNQKENSSFRFTSKQNRQHHHSSMLNKSYELGQDSHMYHTQPIMFKPKIDARNLTYEEFMKQCEYFLLRKKGFVMAKSAHVIRKGAKQIFQFINNHLDYSVDKMTTWIEGIEKDRDYGQFYIERFREMKKNYELGIRSRMGKTELDGEAYRNFSIRNNNQLLDKFRLSHTALNKSKNDFNKTKSNINSRDSLNSSQYKIKDHDLNGQNNLNGQNPQMCLEKIMNQLKVQNKISNQVGEDLMSMDLESFERLFNTFQNNILNQKYSDEMLQKFDTGVLSQLKNKYSNESQKQTQKRISKQSIRESKTQSDARIKSQSQKKSQLINGRRAKTSIQISDLQKKLQIVNRVQDALRKYRSRKFSNISERNSYNMGSTSKGFQTSKRNTQNGQNSKTANSLYSHSKKSSNGDCSLLGSEKNLYDIDGQDKSQNENNFEAIQEDENQLQDENYSGPHKNLKTLLSLGQNVRRSKMFKDDMFNFDSQYSRSHSHFDDSTDREHDMQKSNLQKNKGLLTKAEKYLFEINMGKTIVKKDDSIFTAKRKMRVIKVLLKQNPNSSQASQLENYIKTIQQKIYQKTQKDKKLALLKKSSQSQEYSESQIWKLISLQNLGCNLIFYNISSKIQAEDNDDLCILLNELKMNHLKRFQNRVTYKDHFMNQNSEDIRKSKKNQQGDGDILIQDGMRNMQFQPKVQSQKQIKLTNQTRRTTKTVRNSLQQLNLIAKESGMSGFLNTTSFNQALYEQNLDELNDQQIQSYYQQIKKMFKYAKVHLPETFEKYVKNASTHRNLNQLSNFLTTNQSKNQTQLSMLFI